MPYVGAKQPQKPQMRNIVEDKKVKKKTFKAAQTRPSGGGMSYGDDARPQRTTRPVPQPQPQGGRPQPSFNSGQQDWLNSLSVQDRLKEVMGGLGRQMGMSGGMPMQFNQGQTDWLQSLSLQDQMKELLSAFSRQRPNFGQGGGGGVPSPIGGGGMRNITGGPLQGGGGGFGVQPQGPQLGSGPMINPYQSGGGRMRNPFQQPQGPMVESQPPSMSVPMDQFNSGTSVNMGGPRGSMVDPRILQLFGVVPR